MRVLDVGTRDSDARMGHYRLLMARYTLLLDAVTRRASSLLCGAMHNLVVLTVANLVARQLAEQKVVFAHSDSPLRCGMLVALARHIVARVGCHDSVDVAAGSSRARVHSPDLMLVLL